MATVSFDKIVTIEEPEAIAKLVDSLLCDEPRKIDKQLMSTAAIAEGEQRLKQCLSHS